MNENIQVKSEPCVESNSFSNLVDTNSARVEEPDNDHDPVVKELDVYLARTLANNIFVLQYPIKPADRTFDNANVLSARIKPKQNKLEVEVELDTRNDNYSKVKGEQFALNVDGKLGVSSSSSSSLHNRTGSNKNQEQQQQQQKYFRSNLMDKQVYVSSNAALGKMNKLYHLGAINESGLHLTPVQSVLQMRPSFEYFDIFEKKIKDLKEENDTDYSADETDADASEADKSELVTLKYSLQPSALNQQQDQQDQNWVQLAFNNLNDSKSHSMRNLLYCTKTDHLLQVDLTNEQLMTL